VPFKGFVYQANSPDFSGLLLVFIRRFSGT